MQTPYYIFDADSFIDNYKNLHDAFCRIYPSYDIAYSFKTNYTPAVCKIVLQLGGFAEVVSDMEYELAKRIGFPAQKIIYNGPGKENYFEECILNGGMVNLDNNSEVEKACALGKEHENISVGIRVNFDIGNNLHSRFGIDASSDELDNVVDKLIDKNVKIKGLHFHISRARGLNSWKNRINGVLAIADRVESKVSSNLSYIDLGSGMFGDIDFELKQQFEYVPTYKEYAEVVAGIMAKHYKDRNDKPMLYTEPGTTVISKYFNLYASVRDIKTIRNKQFALLDCSFHNVGEICGLKKVPMKVLPSSSVDSYYSDIDIVGYTCLEQDIMYHGYSGNIHVGDLVEFRNVGGYSIVDKPPFIHPDIPIYMVKDGTRSTIKRAQTFDDIFGPYSF